MALRVAISGATGFIGRALARSLRESGVEVHALRRGRASTTTDITWDPTRSVIDGAKLEGMDAVVHLAGEPIPRRWTAERKRRIRDSRVESTALLARALSSLASPPRVLLAASAVGIYGDRGDELLDETSTLGQDWLAHVTEDWERATAPAARSGTRVVNLRSGLVLDPGGGVLARMLPAFQFGVGGPLGDGRQWASWITLEDEVRAIRFLMDAQGTSGPVNLVTPSPVTNEELSKTLGRVLRRPALVRVPEVVLRALFGEMAAMTVLASQRVAPTRLLGAGFEFRSETLEAGLRKMFGT